MLSESHISLKLPFVGTTNSLLTLQSKTTHINLSWLFLKSSSWVHSLQSKSDYKKGKTSNH